MAGTREELEQIDRALRRLRHVVEPPGMVDDEGRRVEGSTILVLEALADGEPPTVRDVAERLGVAHSTASRLVTRAEEAGMVRRGPSPANRRETVVEATDRGRAMRRRGAEYRIARLAEVVHAWEPQERARFAASLLRFAESAQNTMRGG